MADPGWEVLQRIIRIIFSPHGEWERIAAERADALRALTYALLLAAIPALATAVGFASWHAAPGEGAASHAIDPQRAAWFTFACSWLGVLFVAAAFWLLARFFARTPGWQQAVEVAAYGATPIWLGAAFIASPRFAMVPLIALLHVFYLYWAAAHVVFGIARDECAEFIALAMIGATGAFFLLGAAAGFYGWL